MQNNDSAGEEPHRIVVSPNRSLGPRGAFLFFLIVAIAVLTVAGSFAAVGMWPVLPFAGLELLALAICLYVVQARGLYREVIIVDGDTLAVESGQREPTKRIEFNRHWVQVVLDEPSTRNASTRLLLRAGGQECEIARCLNESQRHSLARRLREVLAMEPGKPGSAGMPG